MPTSEQILKSSIYSDTRKICEETAILLDMEFESDALDVIAELTWKKIQSFSTDLEAFQNHANRSTITRDDVNLLVRNNNSLKELVERKSKDVSKLKPEVKIAKRKRICSAD